MTGLSAEMWLAVYGQVGNGNIAVWLEGVLYEKVPGSWLRCKVVLIPKKGGKSLRVEEFRPVSLNEVSYKIFGAIMREKFAGLSKRMVG